MTETEIKEIVQKQRSYFYTGATLPVEKRLDANSSSAWSEVAVLPVPIAQIGS